MFRDDFFLILVLFFFQCHQKKTENTSTMLFDSIPKPKNISAQSGILEVGGIDAPSYYIWAEYNGVLTGNSLKLFYPDGRANNIPDNQIFADLHIINFYDKDGRFERRSVFEVFPNERKLSIQKDEEISIGTYSGDRVIYVIKGNEKFELVEVLNLREPFNSKKNLGFRFEQVHSIIKLSPKEIDAESVSWGDAYNISIKQSHDKDFYDVMIVTVVGTDMTRRYKLHNRESHPINMSLIRYYDPVLDRIYFVEGAYLEGVRN
jgi:hypothetical protein